MVLKGLVLYGPCASLRWPAKDSAFCSESVLLPSSRIFCAGGMILNWMHIVLSIMCLSQWLPHLSLIYKALGWLREQNKLDTFLLGRQDKLRANCLMGPWMHYSNFLLLHLWCFTERHCCVWAPQGGWVNKMLLLWTEAGKQNLLFGGGHLQQD